MRLIYPIDPLAGRLSGLLPLVTFIDPKYVYPNLFNWVGTPDCRPSPASTHEGWIRAIDEKGIWGENMEIMYEGSRD